MPSPSPDYDDTDWTDDEMLVLAAHAFDDADTAGLIPAQIGAALEELARSRNRDSR